MKVILPNFGAYPTAFAVARVVGPDNIVFVDVNPWLTMDPLKLPKNVKNGILVIVNLFGMDGCPPLYYRYARENNHQIIVDCAQSFGTDSSYVGNTADKNIFSARRVCYFNAHYVFSFYPTKNMGSFGDGGMICTNNGMIWKRLMSHRFYGYADPFSPTTGINSRMDEWQCAAVNEKLEHIDLFEAQMDKTRKIANSYGLHLAGIQKHIFYRNILSGITEKRHMYPILFPNKKVKEMAVKVLDKYKIQHMVHYDHHVSELPAFKTNKTRKVGFRVNNRILSIPLHPYLTNAQISHIYKALKQIRKRYYAKKF